MQIPLRVLGTRKTLIRLATVVLLLMLAGCSSRVRRPDFLASETWEMVFEGFVLVDEAAEEASHDHNIVTIQWPDNLEVGKMYIFHHEEPVDKVAMATSMFPDRLRRIGIEEIDGPRNAEYLIFSYIGGPLFKIQFDGLGHKGRIYSTVDPKISADDQLGKKWSTEDYILIIDS